MALPGRPRILDAVDAMEVALAGMSRGAGYHRNYRGVQRTKWGWEDEQDHDVPWILLTPRGGPPRNAEWGDEVAVQLIRRGYYFEILVHARADSAPDGTLDAIQPWAEISGDIHAALFVDRSLGVPVGVRLFYIGSEPTFHQNANDSTLAGVSVAEVYRIECDHRGGDVATL